MRDISSGSWGQISPSLTQIGVGSFKPNEACFSGPSIFEMGESSLMTSPTPLAHSVKPKIALSDQTEPLSFNIKLIERQGEPTMLRCRTYSVGISSDSLMVAGLEVGFNSEGVAVKPMEDNQSCLDGNSSESTAVDGLEVGTNSDSPVVVPTMTDFFFLLGLTLMVTSQLGSTLMLSHWLQARPIR